MFNDFEMRLNKPYLKIDICRVVKCLPGQPNAYTCDQTCRLVGGKPVVLSTKPDKTKILQFYEPTELHSIVFLINYTVQIQNKVLNNPQTCTAKKNSNKLFSCMILKFNNSHLIFRKTFAYIQ